MVVHEPSTGCLYDASAVRGGVVGLAFAEGDTLSHLEGWEMVFFGQRNVPLRLFSVSPPCILHIQLVLKIPPDNPTL